MYLNVEDAYLFAVLAGALNTRVEVAPPHICALSLAEPVIHQAVAQPDTLLGFCEHHVCGQLWISRGCWWWFDSDLLIEG